MEYQMYSMDNESLTDNFNRVKELIAAALVTEEMISKQDAAIFCRDYAVVVRRPGFWGKLWSKFTGEKTGDAAPITIVKRIGLSLIKLEDAYDSEDSEQGGVDGECSEDSGSTESDVPELRSEMEGDPEESEQDSGSREEKSEVDG